MELVVRVIRVFDIAGLSWDFPKIQDFPGIILVFRDSSGIIGHTQNCPGTLPTLAGLSQDHPMQIFRIVLEMSGTSGFFWDFPKPPGLSWDTPDSRLEIVQLNKSYDPDL